MAQPKEAVMWEAVKSCDGAYDGVFYYAVKTTGIYCRPSCKSRTPVRANVVYFASVPLAVKEGYRPCKRCRPDLLEAPNGEEIIETVRQIIEEEYASSLTLDVLAKRVGMSKYHLQRMYKSALGQSPLEFITEMRLHRARELLHGTQASITEIAHDLGYKSSAYFAVVFRRYYHCTPNDYRNRNRGDTL